MSVLASQVMATRPVAGTVTVPAGSSAPSKVVRILYFLGTTYLFSDADLYELDDREVLWAEYGEAQLYGEEDDQQFGYDLAGGADLDGDGTPDIVVGVPGYYRHLGVALAPCSCSLSIGCDEARRMAAMAAMAAIPGLRGRTSMGAMGAHGTQPLRFLADGWAFMGAMVSVGSVGSVGGITPAHTTSMAPMEAVVQAVASTITSTSAGAEHRSPFTS